MEIKKLYYSLAAEDDFEAAIAESVAAGWSLVRRCIVRTHGICNGAQYWGPCWVAELVREVAR